jgi:polysaccharide pyruvyl transferase WcaK-like protein
VTSKDRTPRVLCYGFLGMGNVGNEASLSAFLIRLRAGRPQARPWCLGMGPEDVERRHGIPARRLTSGRPGLPPVPRIFTRLADIPRTWWLIGRADTVVVPGMGVFESSLGAANPFGLPYWLFVVALGARLRRRRLLFLSVGADRPHHPVTAFFFRHTLRLATYCSFRDELSARAAREMAGTALAAPVRPDLAFGLPSPEPPSPHVPGRIVVGVMRFGPRDDPSVMGQYRAKLVRAISSLVHQGASIRLVIGDVADLPLADEIADAVRSSCEVDEARVAVSHADNQNDLMAEMAGAEVVAASRYHNVIAALRVGVPVVSLGYAGKNAALLERFGLAELDQPIEEFDPDVLLRHIAEARASSRSQLRRVLAQMQESLREQELEIAPLLEST